MTPGFKRAVWIFNTCGFVFYLAWLATMGDKQILREQDGIVYFLPVLPFFFVYMLLIEPKPPAPADAPPAPARQAPRDAP
jgi:quinol-cytochrome oxidoreductase complex cytochrome b subunit